MDSNESRRKSKRLIEKCVNSNEVKHQINDKKTKIKSKTNTKCVKLKENEITVGKSLRNGGKPLNGMIEVISERKYGLRKLTPINWKERLDSRHVITDNKTIDNKSIDKTKGRNCLKIEDKIVSKNKEKKVKTNKILGKINGKLSTKVDHKLNNESIEIINAKRTKRRLSNNRIYDQLIGETNLNKCNNSPDVEVNGQAIDSTLKSTDLCQTNVSNEQQLQESEVQEKDGELSDDISYIQYLEQCSESESKAPSLSFNIIINLLKHRLKIKKRNKRSESVDRKRKLYSCGYDLCDSKRCQNFSTTK